MVVVVVAGHRGSTAAAAAESASTIGGDAGGLLELWSEGGVTCSKNAAFGAGSSRKGAQGDVRHGPPLLANPLLLQHRL